MGSRKRITFALVGLVLLVVAGWLIREVGSDPAPGDSGPAGTAPASQSAKPGGQGAAVPGQDSGLRVTALSKLPQEATTTWRLIEKGGPYPYDRDGVVFENREKRLPAKAREYYHEYTVPTPGSRDRGARRLIYGKERELYYTENHYDSFVLVDPGK
ncbi:ribonuclease domain-containing protein [Kibdelosporangium phytohabitans]|uniref:Ribonuclease N n=1 Tax=Kibdelosporangium phytohabitans TaxID=860235 RepID=A0A0N9I037_9PSEU|nr:ribonuclease domain-containing protein [Kibdelosporangium phytohabitans]ALG07522.1 ribonuclease N [Kibdelosporangium phytohabitans]MBE1471558.1 guanyl-specific ribonuclease Sa [Kibdelosporangium phytohabitans]